MIWRSFSVPVVCIAMVCAVLGFAAQADAHVTGLSWTATTTPYVVDVGYDPNEFQAGQSARFDFVLRDEKTGDSVPYDHVWVRLMHENTTLLATGVRRQYIGPTTLLFGLIESGDYKLEASFRDADGNDTAVASFPMSITGEPFGLTDHIDVGAAFVAGIITGVLGFVTAARRTRKSL